MSMTDQIQSYFSSSENLVFSFLPSYKILRSFPNIILIPFGLPKCETQLCVGSVKCVVLLYLLSLLATLESRTYEMGSHL